MTSLAHNHRVGVRADRQIGAWAWRCAAALIIVAHVLLALWWGLIVPLGEGPDEPGHLRYALFLAEHGNLPVQRSDASKSDVPGEGHQPPLAYWLMQPVVHWLPADELTLEMGANPHFRWNGGDQPNAYFRSTREIPPYHGVALVWHLARGISALLGGITVWLVYLTTRRCFPSMRWLALGAAALVAINPQFIFAHALVSNDPLLITLTSSLIYVSVALITPREQRRSDRPLIGGALMAGVLLGAMLITKQSAIAFVPLPFLALVLRHGSLKQRIIGSAMVAAVAVAISGWWYVRNARLYGDPLGLTAFQQTFATGDFNAASWRNWSGGLWNLLRSSFGMFGWLTIALSDGAYSTFAIVLILALIGLIVSVGQGWWRGRGAVAVLLIVAVALAFIWTVAFARTAGAVAWQGRFLFPAAPALALLLACGLGAVLPQRSALWTTVGLLFVLAVALPRGLISPSYTSDALPPQPENVGNVYGRFDVGFKRGVELRDVEYPREATAGDTINVTLTWHALEQMDRPWTVFLHLVDSEKTIVAERNAQPLDGRFPTNGWVRGDWIRDPKQLVLTGVPPGTYMLRVGLWDEASEDRLGVYNRNKRLIGDAVTVGPIVVKPRQ